MLYQILSNFGKSLIVMIHLTYIWHSYVDVWYQVWESFMNFIDFFSGTWPGLP